MVNQTVITLDLAITALAETLRDTQPELADAWVTALIRTADMVPNSIAGPLSNNIRHQLQTLAAAATQPIQLNGN